MNYNEEHVPVLILLQKPQWRVKNTFYKVKKKKGNVSIRRPANVYKDKYKQQCAQLNFGLTHQIVTHGHNLHGNIQKIHI